MLSVLDVSLLLLIIHLDFVFEIERERTEQVNSLSNLPKYRLFSLYTVECEDFLGVGIITLPMFLSTIQRPGMEFSLKICLMRHKCPWREQRKTKSNKKVVPYRTLTTSEFDEGQQFFCPKNNYLFSF